LKKHIKNILPKNRFARNVSLIAGGTVAGQVMLVLASPLLTRLYSPEDFGLLAIYASLLAIIGVIASLRYQLAIPLPESDEEAAHVVILSLLVVLGITLLTTLVVVFFRDPIANAANTPALTNYLWLLPVGLLMMGSYQVFNYWAIRTKTFPAIARTKLTQALSMVGVQLGGYLFGPLALLMGHVAGQAAGTTSLGILAIKKRWAVFRRVHLIGIIHAAIKYRHFPLYSTWGGVFNTTGRQLPPLLFAVLFNSSAAGIYMLAHRVLTMPMTLVGRAIAQVFFSNAAEAHRKGQLAPLVAKIHEKLASIAMPPALILVLAGPELFTIVFGSDWRQAGEFAQWMAVYIYFQFITSPLSQLVSVLEKQIQGTCFQAALMIMQLAGLSIGTVYGSLILSVALFSLGSVVCYFGFLVWIVRATDNNLTVLWRPTAKAMLCSLPLVSPLIIFCTLGGDFIFWIIALFLTGVLVGSRYFFLLKKAWQ